MFGGSFYWQLVKTKGFSLRCFSYILEAGESEWHTGKSNDGSHWEKVKAFVRCSWKLVRFAKEAVMGPGCREEQKRLLWELVGEKSKGGCYGSWL